VVLRARASEAGERPEPIRFEYAADPPCPSREEMLRRIASYTTRWTLTEEEGTRRFDVRIVRRGHRFSGRLELTPRKRDGAERSETIARAIEANECEDVVTGLAIATALAIDPRASLLPQTETSAERSDDPVETTPEDPFETTPGPEERPSLPQHAPSEPQQRPQPPREPGGPAAVGVALSARIEASSAVSGVLGDVGVFAEVGSRPLFPQLRWLAPTLRLGGKHSLTRRTEVGTIDVSISWKAAALEGCPVRVALAERLLLDACVTGSVGLLSVEAPNAPRPTFHRRLWIDYGGMVAVRWLAGSRLFFDVVGGLTFPVLRDRFRIEPGGLATLAPPVGWSLAVGGGWRL